MRLLRKSEHKAKDAPALKQRNSGQVFWISAALIFGFALTYDYPALTFLCAAVFFYLPALCVHELGHAISAVCLGGRVHHITLGQRPNTALSPRKIRLLGFDWHLYSTAFCGAVYSSLYSKHFYRLRRCLVIIAGPGANLFAGAPAFYLIDFGHFTRFTPLPITWLFINIYLAFTSFSPVEMRPTEGGLKRDISVIWKTLFLSDKEIQEFVQSAALTRAYLERSTEIEALTLPQLLILHESDPQNAALLCHVFHRMQKETDSRQGDYLQKLAILPSLPRAYAIQVIDGYITHQLALGPPTQPEPTAQLSAQLLDWTDTLTHRGTRGSVLVDLGRIEEGQIMLKDVLIKTTSTVDKTYANIFLALAEKQQGHLDLARDYAAKAAKIDPHCPALRRVADLLPPAPNNGNVSG